MEQKIAMHMYSDTCAGQNKNSFILAMMLYAIQHTELGKIALCFLEGGHTQIENDSVHATIERAKKKHQQVFVPTQYASLIR